MSSGCELALLALLSREPRGAPSAGSSDDGWPPGCTRESRSTEPLPMPAVDTGPQQGHNPVMSSPGPRADRPVQLPPLGSVAQALWAAEGTTAVGETVEKDGRR